MALVPSFSCSESLANNDLITLTDTSTGVDGTITTRRIYIQLANGNWLTEAGESTTSVYTTWSYSDSTITLDVLTQSTACEITVEWLAGSTVTYEVTNTFCFDLYDYLFMLQTLQGQTSNPGINQDNNYTTNVFTFMVNLSNAENSITYGGDIYSSQNALSQNQIMIDNESFYF